MIFNAEKQPMMYGDFTLNFTKHPEKNGKTIGKIPRNTWGPQRSPSQWTGIEGKYEGEDWHNRNQNLRTQNQGTKTTRLSGQWLWQLLPQNRNPIWINATYTQALNSWPVAGVNYVPLIIKVQTPGHTNPRFAILSQQTVSFNTKPRFGRKQSRSFGIRRGQIFLQFKHIYIL